MANSKVWTKKLVQEHARVAVAIELYTIPFYTTVMTSIKSEDSEAYKILRGILIEEMMHLQLAANLCVALDTTPRLSIPNYTRDIPYLKPGVVINADMEPLNARTMAEMLAIETPEDVVADGSLYRGPDFPYSSIGEMYHALLCGIERVGVENFGWKTENQQKFWADQGYPQIIQNLEDAKRAIQAIEEQGEGKPLPSGVEQPYEPSDFKVESVYQMVNEAPVGGPNGPYRAEITLKEYSHYGRLLKIQQDALHNNGLPEVYTGRDNPNHLLNQKLEVAMAAMIGELGLLWVPGGIMPPEIRWKAALGYMRTTAELARECWEEGVVPDWS
jgi:hypothetical protein